MGAPFLPASCPILKSRLLRFLACPERSRRGGDFADVALSLYWNFLTIQRQANSKKNAESIPKTGTPIRRAALSQFAGLILSAAAFQAEEPALSRMAKGSHSPKRASGFLSGKHWGTFRMSGSLPEFYLRWTKWHNSIPTAVARHAITLRPTRAIPSAQLCTIQNQNCGCTKMPMCGVHGPEP